LTARIFSRTRHRSIANASPYESACKHRKCFPHESAAREGINAPAFTRGRDSVAKDVGLYARLVGNSADPRVAAKNLSVYYKALQEAYERIGGRRHEALQPLEDDGWVMDGYDETGLDVTFDKNVCAKE
jgi:hypothetical protein